MLRYKNSLLERILLEKGIDVQAELRAKTSPNLGPTHMPHNLVQPPPIHRALLNRHHARRSNSSIAPKLEPGIAAGPLPPPLQSPHAHSTGASPRTRPTPPSHSASPTGTTSFSSQHGASPATSGSDHISGHIRHQQPPNNSMKAPPVPVANLASAGAAAAAAAVRQVARQQRPGQPQVSVGVSNAPFYATQAYQNHLEQLGKLTPFFSRLIPLQ
jgi:hypothetical protein